MHTESLTQDKYKITAVIVTWNSRDEILYCLTSLIDNVEKDKYELEVIVIDNLSGDGTQDVVEKFSAKFTENFIFIKNDSNTGYTYACNQGMRKATGDYVLILNPDTIIQRNSLSLLVDAINYYPSAMASAPQLLNEDGTVQYSCRTLPKYRDIFFELLLLSTFFPRSKFFSRWKMMYFSHNEVKEVEQPMAAALMVKNYFFRESGYMDERFYMFFNDVDLCKRIIDSRNKIIFYPESKIIHKKGVSVYKDRARMIKAWNSDCRKYFKKHNCCIGLYFLLSAGLYVSGVFRILALKISKSK